MASKHNTNGDLDDKESTVECHMLLTADRECTTVKEHVTRQRHWRWTDRQTQGTRQQAREQEKRNASILCIPFLPICLSRWYCSFNLLMSCWSTPHSSTPPERSFFSVTHTNVLCIFTSIQCPIPPRPLRDPSSL